MTFVIVAPPCCVTAQVRVPNKDPDIFVSFQKAHNSQFPIPMAVWRGPKTFSQRAAGKNFKFM
jgi:hypothetical protein